MPRVLPTSPLLGSVLFGSALLASSCSGAPAGPSLDERVSGVWIGRSTLMAATGGECVGASLQAAIGSKDVFAAPIGQAGSELISRVAYEGNATECAFAGTATGADVRLMMTSCRAGRIPAVRCTDGTVRDLEIVSDQITARAINGSGSGTETISWRVTAPGTGITVGTLNVTAGFIWNVLRLPASDFHVFDGSILPGYVDGVITIPEEADPFCVICGWFNGGAV
jgi:hypothetical protein